jgi:hypothetical protein
MFLTQFTDANAPAIPQRCCRVRWPWPGSA